MLEGKLANLRLREKEDTPLLTEWFGAHALVFEFLVGYSAGAFHLIYYFAFAPACSDRNKYVFLIHF